MSQARGDDDQIRPLSGKPFFTTVVCPSHIKPVYNLFLPAKMYDILPSKDVPAVFTCKGKEWEMAYHGGRTKGKRFSLEWKHFAAGNDLHVGDACIFELMVCTARQLKFHVQILRGDIPPAFQGRICGARSDLPLAVKSEI